jgi:3-hydroxymyristoyl/3-hydroxydecanoyl-(acyl carrier protein) dehydratase
MFETCRSIPADHPCLAGHFPGAPIVPAVVILDEVASALSEWKNAARIAAFSAVKFLLPIKPEQPFMVQFSETAPGDTEVAFSCRIGQQVAVQGRLLIRGNPS